MVLGTENPDPAPRATRLPPVVLLVVVSALVAIFTVLLFPYERFADIAVARISQATGASVSMGDLGGGIGIGGPSLRATDLLLRWPDGQELELEQARIRPAWIRTESRPWIRPRRLTMLAKPAKATATSATVRRRSECCTGRLLLAMGVSRRYLLRDE